MGMLIRIVIGAAIVGVGRFVQEHWLGLSLTSVEDFAVGLPWAVVGAMLWSYSDI